MFFKKSVALSILVLNTFQVLGCTNMTQVTPLNQESNSVNSSKQQNQQNAAKKDLSFSKVSEERFNSLSGFMSRGLIPNSSTGSTSDISSAPSVSPTAAPTAMASSMPYPAATGSAMPDGIYGSGSTSSYTPYYPTPMPYPVPTGYSSYNPGYYGGSYFGSTFEEYVVSDFEEAKTIGYTGSYLSVIKDVINPIIAGLSSDSRLISAYGNTNKKGVTVKNPVPSPTITPVPTPPTPTATPFYDPSITPSPYSYSYTPSYQWQFTYASSSKKEIYSILVSSDEVLVLKQKWKLRELANNEIKIDSNQAIEIAEKAIKNTNYPAPEYFYGNNGESLYEIPEDASLSYTLSEEGKGLMVWNINITKNEFSSEHYYNNGYVKINARTGEIINLQRMTRFKNYPTSSPYPYITPTPYASPTPSVVVN